MTKAERRLASRKRGLRTMVLGTVFSAVGAYLFQVLGGRVLGTDGFAPVSIVWTLFFLGFTIVLIPIEQLAIRRLTLGMGDLTVLRKAAPTILAAIVALIVSTWLFTAFNLDNTLDGNSTYLVQIPLLFVGYTVFAIGRGVLAGQRRFHAYGLVVGGESMGRLLIAVAALAISQTPVAMVWAMVLAPIGVLAVRPFRRSAEPRTATTPGDESDRRFLGGFLVAQATSQTVLAAGPLVVASLGGTSAEISIFFATFTLFRGPLTASYNLVARALPEFTRLAAAGERSVLRSWGLRISGITAATAAVGALVASFVGPLIVAALFGAEFEPSSIIAVQAVVGVVAAMGILFLTQILVAQARTTELAAVWMVGLLAAAATIWLLGGNPMERVGWGFIAGHAVALTGLTGAVLASRDKTQELA